MSFVWTELRVDVKGEDVGGSLREIMTDIEEGEDERMLLSLMMMVVLMMMVMS